MVSYHGNLWSFLFSSMTESQLNLHRIIMSACGICSLGEQTLHSFDVCVHWLYLTYQMHNPENECYTNECPVGGECYVASAWQQLATGRHIVMGCRWWNVTRQDFQTLSIICLIIIFPEQSIFLIATILTTWTCSGHGNNWNTVHMTLNYKQSFN